MRAGWMGVWLACIAPSIAAAQPATDAFGIERFQLAIDPHGVLDVDGATVHPHLAVSGGVFLGFAHDPLVVYDSQMSPVEALVDRRLTTGLVGAIGLYGRAEVGVGLDIVGYQHGSDDSPTMKSLPAGGIGDARLVGKLQLVRAARVELAVIPALIIPGGSASGYLREAGLTFAPAIAVSSTIDQLRIAANVGYRLRPRTEVAGLVSDDELVVRAGLAYAIGFGEVYASASIATPVRDREANLSAIEALAGGALPITSRLSAFVAGGAGLDNGFGVPDWRALAGLRVEYSPRTTRQVTLIATPPVAVVEKPVVVETKVAQLAGRVVDREGHPIPHATVNVAGREVTTDDDGRFAAEYAGGAIAVPVIAEDYQPISANANVAAGERGSIEVVLVRAVRQGQLRGQVLSFGGKPVAATISVLGKTSARTQTDAEGQFTLDLPDGPFEVTIEAAGYQTQKRNVSVKLDGVTVLNVDLRGVK